MDLTRHATEIAPDLLGVELLGPHGSGRIVEVEAYGGSEDPASHAFRGPTPRSGVMFGPAGILYVYLIYGVHHCANVVTGRNGDGQAVLIRAVEPSGDLAPLRAARPGARRDRDLTNGPGKLCAALGISRIHDGSDLTNESSEVRLDFTSRQVPRRIDVSARIGITVAQELPWRWYVHDNDWVTPRRAKGIEQYA